jgi:glycosyltransferase involved in cell wall biosynthesis
MRYRFFNTYEPVTTLYRDVVPALVSRGHEVDIVLSRAVYRPGREDLERVVGHLDGVRMLKTASLGVSPTSGSRKALLTAIYVVQSAIYSLFGPPVDLNIFLTQPPLFTLWGWVLSAVRGQPYCSIVMDVYPQQMIAYGLLKEDSLLARLLSWLSVTALRKADDVIVIGRCMARQLNLMGVPSERISFIPNWMDEDLVLPIEPADNPLRAEWGLEGKFVVLYAGNMGLAHYFDDVLAVAHDLKTWEDLAFVFVGGGARYEEVEAEVEAKGLTNVLLLPFQAMDKWTEVLGVGDLHLVVFRDKHTGFGVPSKTYASLAAGRPVLYQGSDWSEIARMIQEQDVGAVLPCGDTAGLRESIIRYLNEPELLRRQGRRARQLAEGVYSRAESIRRYVELLTGEARLDR